MAIIKNVKPVVEIIPVRSMVAKVILIFNKLSFVNMFSGKPLLFSIIWKTFIFSLFTLLFRCVEELIPLISKYGSLPSAGQHLIHEIAWPHFWSSQIVLLDTTSFLFHSRTDS
jgi:hypothetical protein